MSDKSDTPRTEEYEPISKENCRVLVDDCKAALADALAAIRGK